MVKILWKYPLSLVLSRIRLPLALKCQPNINKFKKKTQLQKPNTLLLKNKYYFVHYLLFYNLSSSVYVPFNPDRPTNFYLPLSLPNQPLHTWYNRNQHQQKLKNWAKKNPNQLLHLSSINKQPTKGPKNHGRPIIKGDSHGREPNA